MQSVRGSACERCARGEGCGGGIIGKLAFRTQPVLEIDVPDAGEFAPGQTVELSVPAQRVMALAALVYLIPLLGLLLGALSGQWAFGSDTAAILSGATGMALALWVIRKRIESAPEQWLSPSVTSAIKDLNEQ